MQVSDVQEGSTVRAFHPHAFGVIYTGTVARVGRKWVHVTFPLFGHTVRVAPRDIVEVTAYLPTPDEVA